MAHPSLSLDFETRSAADIRLGPAHYARHQTTSVLCLAWSIGGDEPRLWLPWEPVPAVLVQHIRAGRIVRAWNAAFEYEVWNQHMAPRCGGVKLISRQMRCTMVEAQTLGLPGQLEEFGRLLGCPVQKDSRGKELIQLCCIIRPPKPVRYKKDGTPYKNSGRTREPTEQDFLDLYAYCVQDVRAEKHAATQIVRLIPEEQALWDLTLRINERGVRIDHESALVIQKALVPERARANEKLAHLTGGEITKASQRARIWKWVCDRLWIPSLTGADIDSVLSYPCDPVYREVLTLRREFGQVAASKIDRMVTLGDRVRYHLRMNAAHTGRYTSSGVQLQNLKKPPPRYDYAAALGRFWEAWTGEPIESPVSTAGLLVRYLLRADKGKKLLAADYRQIEARVVLWLGGDHEVLESFKSGDPYLAMAERIWPERGKLNKKDHVTERELGKITVLGCGFGLGWVALLAKLPKGSTPELAQLCVSSYRELCKGTVAMWYEATRAIQRTILTGEPSKLCNGHVTAEMITLPIGPFLTLILPSGRRLWYFKPDVRDVPSPWDADKPLRTATFVGYASKAGKGRWWGRQYMSHSVTIENVVQAIARDIMANCILRIDREKPDWETLMLVHDENVVQVDEGGPDHTELEAMMRIAPDWADGLPVDAEGWTGDRYRK